MHGGAEITDQVLDKGRRSVAAAAALRGCGSAAPLVCPVLTHVWEFVAVLQAG